MNGRERASWTPITRMPVPYAGNSIRSIWIFSGQGQSTGNGSFWQPIASGKARASGDTKPCCI